MWDGEYEDAIWLTHDPRASQVSQDPEFTCDLFARIPNGVGMSKLKRDKHGFLTMSSGEGVRGEGCLSSDAGEKARDRPGLRSGASTSSCTHT